MILSLPASHSQTDVMLMTESAPSPAPVSRRAVISGLVGIPLLALTPRPAQSLGGAPTTSISAPRLSGLPGQGQGFLFGLYSTSLADAAALETAVDHQLPGLAQYRDCNAWTSWPTRTEEPYTDRGNVFRYPIESRVYNYASYDPPAGVPQPTWRHTNPANGKVYAGYRHVDFTSGRLDQLLEGIAAGIKTIPGTVLIDYEHEMDDNRWVLRSHPADWGVITHNRSAAYTNPANPDRREFIDAHRYIVDYLRAAGVQNALYGFCVAGWTLGRNADRLGDMYPGDEWVDLVMWDPYNGQGAWRSFAQIVEPLYSAIDDGLYGSGAQPKARFLGEFGCRYRDSRRAGWIKDMATEVRDFPKLRGGVWFSSGSWGAIHGEEGTVQERRELGAMLRSSYFTLWRLRGSKFAEELLA